MAFVGLGLYLVVALFFAVHVLRTGRSLFWVFILFSFPLLGSLIYLVVEYLPDSRMHRSTLRPAVTTGHAVDPDRELHEARSALERLPSAQNQLRLANALLARGETREAVHHYDACLAGPFGADPEIRYGAASAKLADGALAEALQLAVELRDKHPDYQPERSMLLLAQILAASGDRSGARAVFSAALERFGTVEVRGQYAIFAANSADLATAERLYGELAQAEKQWPLHIRSVNRPLLQSVQSAIADARRSA